MMVRIPAGITRIARAVGLGAVKWWLIKQYRELRLTAPLYLGRQPFVGDPATGLIVSLTSFPGRITRVWIAIEHILRQDTRPWKVVLVLAEEEFPDRQIPRSLRRLEARGIEILWTITNFRSFNKLLPVRAKYPDATIITMDDDLAYEPWRVRLLVDASHSRPGAIVGHRGWEVGAHNGAFTAYETWQPAGPRTPSHRCFLTGVGGVLYPPSALPAELLRDSNLAQRLCPTNDDIWFWAVARRAGASMHCLGNNSLPHISQLPGTPALSHRNWGEHLNDQQLHAIGQHFGFEQLIPELSW
jgi:hypothetical protein